ncbi:hypothetical protein Cycma_4520 [Cyclobacterium marinum DSM 745]|uniref:Uncharacterized protein n=1 Tax=Cyclobacterium marinum (strain ATCC 25205 / DSM 745 / LMG 13164 / NCIMB 1802) TaxID=880070 RepID=G0J0E2_CYCMS|nr:hypothetical protein Cycma_4520 [Cyclobacterium marinum DSM 745]|tara:strand:- start:649 stop:816 length:168 start_codon:yes stop_codon:yes gene_type:complete
MENKEVKKPGNGCYNENGTNQHNKKPFQNYLGSDLLLPLFPLFYLFLFSFFKLYK